MVVVVIVMVVVEALRPCVAADGGSFLGQEHTGVLGGSEESCGEAPDQVLFCFCLFVFIACYSFFIAFL